MSTGTSSNVCGGSPVDAADAVDGERDTKTHHMSCCLVGKPNVIDPRNFTDASKEDCLFSIGGCSYPPMHVASVWMPPDGR
jgi:hypothetical protein